jgi:hypothetical protein
MQLRHTSQPLPKGNEMTHPLPSSRSRVRLATFLGVFLAAALAITLPARGEVVQAKSVSLRTKGVHREAKAESLKVAKPVNSPLPGLHRDVLTLEEGQKSLQRQFEIMIGAEHRRAADLDRQIGTFDGQLTRLASQQQDLTTTQQRLTGTVHSLLVFLVIISVLLILLCGALFLFIYQSAQFRGFRFRERRQISPPPSEAPDRAAYDPQWKVGS